MVNPYLTRQDAQSSIRDHRLQHITDNVDDDNTVDPFNLSAGEAQSIARNYLLRYAIDEEYAKLGEERNKSLIFHIKNIALYILFERIEDDDVPERIIKNYNDTMEYLMEVSKGKMAIDLPLKEEDTDGDGIVDAPTTKFRAGGEKRRRNY